MNQREKFLLAGLSLLLTGVIAWDPVASAILSSSSETDEQIAAVLEDLQSKQRSYDQMQQKLRRLQQAKSQSLPEDSAVAIVAYQEFLVTILQQSKIDDASINAAAPIPIEALGTRLQFTVQMRATAGHLGSFLGKLESSQLLHHVTQLQIQQASGPDSSQCNITVAIEALAVLGSGNANSREALKSLAASIDRQQELLVKDVFKRPERVRPPKELRDSLVDLYKLLPKSAQVGDSASQPKAKVSGPPDSLNQLAAATSSLPSTKEKSAKLVGIIHRDTERSALFLQPLTQQPLMLNLSESLEVLGVQGTIQQIESDCIEVSMEQGTKVYRLGDEIQ